MTQTVYKFVFTPWDLCIKTLFALELTRLWPLQRKYWTPTHHCSLFFTLLCPFSLSILSFSLWFVSCGKSLRAAVTTDTRGKKTEWKPTSLGLIVNIWWTVPPWISHSILWWACDVQNVRVQMEAIRGTSCAVRGPLWPGASTSTTNKKNTVICLDANVPKSEGVSCLLMFTTLSMCIIMLTCFRLTPSISVLSSADPLGISQLESANMDWLLHFQKSQSSPDAPWLLNRVSQESRGEAAICISHGAWRPHCCRGREGETATSVYLSQRKREKMSERRILGRLTQSLSALKVLPLFLLPPYFPPIYWLLHCSLPSLISFSDFFFAVGLTLHGCRPWLAGLQSPESIDRASRAPSKCSRSNKSITLLLQQSPSHWWHPPHSASGCFSRVREGGEIWQWGRQSWANQGHSKGWVWTLALSLYLSYSLL